MAGFMGLMVAADAHFALLATIVIIIVKIVMKTGYSASVGEAVYGGGTSSLWSYSSISSINSVLVIRVFELPDDREFNGRPIFLHPSNNVLQEASSKASSYAISSSKGSLASLIAAPNSMFGLDHTVSWTSNASG
ncbi:5130_t:CDS:2 [Ambispora gerdemannii]|uniref:5130_t:CDS:1 n=1 Tax=Ambispora gerdemannii TaxID=144530 RepID=A0A9N8WC48_9GLOM|nr:5130_t:CDS:2 [Ambispora gerdemannii]